MDGPRDGLGINCFGPPSLFFSFSTSNREEMDSATRSTTTWYCYLVVHRARTFAFIIPSHCTHPPILLLQINHHLATSHRQKRKENKNNKPTTQAKRGAEDKKCKKNGSYRDSNAGPLASCRQQPRVNPKRESYH